MKGKITTYIINLPSSTVRRKYMADLLSPYQFLGINFLNAINGRLLSEEKRAQLYDENLCLSHYGRRLNPGEIGCVCSHRKTYDCLLKSDDEYALVLEDDIHLMRSLGELQSLNFDKYLNTKKPRILLLSGDYWYYRRREGIVDVYDAVGAYAYFINKAAAKSILSIPKPYNVADDWNLYKRLGVNFFAIMPYLIDANVNMDLLGSDVSQDIWGINRRLMSRSEIFMSYRDAIIKKILKSLGHFESKIRVLHNKVVEPV